MHQKIFSVVMAFSTVVTVAYAQSWMLKETPYPHSLFGPAAYDEARERTVVFDVNYWGVGPCSTWEWDGNEWARQDLANSPSFVTSPAMVYDSARSRIVLFGWSTNAPGETWEWDGMGWTQLNPAQSPPGAASDRWAMAYDPSRSRTVLFGWPTTAAGETWEWDGVNWVRSLSFTVPSPRSEHAMAFDPVRQTVLLFGGYLKNDTWEWDGSDWAQLTPTQSPAVGTYPSMATDVTRGRVVLCRVNLSGASEIWEWDGSNTNWTPRPANPAPPARGSLAYDVVRRRAVYTSTFETCEHAATWEWDGNVWLDRSGSTFGPTVFSSSSPTSYDLARDRLVLVGFEQGCSPTMVTWEWDGWHWTRASPPASPSLRSGSAMTYDGTTSSTLLFGGITGSFPPFRLSDTWVWNGTTWAQRQPTTVPPPREGSAMAYDSGRNRVVLFGGGGNSLSILGDTYEWDGSDWHRRSPTRSPAPRVNHAMAYDSVRGRTVLVGGDGYTGALDDTWEWDGTSWMLVSPANGPSGYLRSMAYSLSRQRCVINTSAPVSGQWATWEWDGATWTSSVQGSGGPPMNLPAYDSIRDRILALASPGPDLWVFDSFTAADSVRTGTSCGGATTPRITSDGRPWLGNTAFGIDLHDLPPFGPAITMIGVIPTNTSLGSGCTLYVDPATVVITAFTLANAHGFAHQPLPIPALAPLLGGRLFTQSVTLDPASPFLGLALTGRLELRLGE